MADRLIKGVDVDDDTLAIDVIKRVGAGGHFPGDKHSVDWFEKNSCFLAAYD